ncbi:MAG: DUF559 domain-containing protein [Candidatus Magasanikbacteria bacterium]|nr:DUF559 domain-containing protein [Candidatus Magasanikbacteria bacterium]
MSANLKFFNRINLIIPHQLKLIIEVDGGIHEEQVGYDNKRDDWLKEQGYKILRLKNEDVIYNLDLVLNQINNFINQG